ncbi:hypothetical protein MCOR27_002106 [Pyricularia oryzae]|uniref:Borealin N-terminal domain-containing protein n=1 Tax=Pyricularia grisea TaxID=148305 RepID=A0ABQ8NWV1_PYRGI|nr:hypothetical protein MCOR01_002109 [Pyricularia oryzae]KAI6303304.1 hypothetical protein MCOR33_001567 [Pyricularia grisea]KAH9429301.1 hypothetical protein MCOR02_010707 [Pyricularia oryzae]KAI6263745.1 hypothetical protein MCOR19_000078 [Pyricularia oryzae]KAI6285818.1 hypothetical protein MCOR27_002106 [Pyricularia oryzae]
MPPARTRKRKSEDSVADENNTPGTEAGERIPTKTGSPVRTPTGQGPAKRRKLGITMAQKQALIDNLQLEITERARKLRAQYNLQAQGLRTRVEIRVNRIPMALRKAKMGDLVAKYTGGGSSTTQHASSRHAAAASQRPPPVPEKDVPPKRPMSQASTTAGNVSRGPGRPPKRLSNEMAGFNKENVDANSPKKRVRASPAPDVSHNPSQVLSPTSSNTRIVPRKRVPPGSSTTEQQPPRPASPAKSFIARPASPMKKPSHNNLLSNMVEKARSTRAAATRKTTTSSTASSAAGGGTTRTRKAAAATTATAASRAAAPSRTGRRVSGISESSDGSTATVVRKRPATTASQASTRTAAPAPAKRTVMGTIRKGVAGATTRKAPATKAPPAPTTTTGRVLRKRT